MVKFSDEIKALDFSIDDIDRIIEVLQKVKKTLETDDEWGYDIDEISDGIIIQAYDRDHIWIEPVSNITD